MHHHQQIGWNTTFALREAPINLPQPRSKLKIPLNLALLTAKYPVRAALASLSAHFSVLRA